MEPNLRQTYLDELAEKTVDFMAIWTHFVAACAAFEGPVLPQTEADVVRWRVKKFAADLLVTAAQIGRILDPHPMRGSAEFQAACRLRGEELRRELGIPDDSPLLDVTLRNALEHIDEYIDAWVAENPSRLLHTWAISTTRPDEAPLGDAIRRINVRELDVFVMSRRTNLRAMQAAIVGLQAALPRVHRSEMMVRFDDPTTGESDVIAIHRVHSSNERPPTQDPPPS